MSEDKGKKPEEDKKTKDGTTPEPPVKPETPEPTPPVKPVDDTPPPEPPKPEPPVEPPAEPKEKLDDKPVVDKEALKKEIKDEITAEDEEAERTHQAKIDRVRAGWTNEYSTLAKAGKVPKIKDVKDESDRGVKAKRALLIKLGQIIQHNKETGNDHVPSLSQVLLLHPEVLSPSPGGELPISGSSRPTGDSGAFSNAEIRGKSFQQIAKEGT